MIQYLDKKGRLLFVSNGIGQPPTYGTFYRKNPGGGKRRVKSRNLPMRRTKREAEKDFEWYVRYHRLVPVTVSHQE